MFKYIKEILITFTPGQRLIALLLLLLSICIITIGPKMLQTLSHDDTDIYNRLNIQKGLISQQSKEIDRLNTSIIENQIKCTNRILDRENEIVNEIDNLQKNIKTNLNKNKLPNLETVSAIIVDTVSSGVGLENPIPIQNDNIETNNILSGLQRIKNKIKKRETNAPLH